MLLNLLLRPIGSGLHARAIAGSEPRPADGTLLRSGADEPVRVLLAGSGVTTGWGVRTHGLALAGALQQQLQRSLGQPVDVDQVSEPGAVLSDASRVIGSRATERWDVVVLAFGLSDAVRLTPVRTWAQGLDRLLAQLDGDLPRGPLVPIVIVGIPPDPFTDPGVFAAAYRRQAERLNAVTARAASRNRRASFAALPPMADRAQRPGGSPEGYRSWAAAIADRVVPVVSRDAEQVAAGAPARPAGRLTTAALDPANALVRRRLQAIAHELRERTDVDLVVVTLQDGARLWSVADSVAGRPRSVPLARTFCAVTMQEDVLQVRDATGDPRFAEMTGSPLQQFDSYAGVALRDAHGTAVGTVGLFDGGLGEDIDPEVLRSAGRAAESQLARLVSAVDGGAIFPQRGRLLDAAAEVPDPGPSAGVPAPDAAQADAGALAAAGAGAADEAAARVLAGGRLSRRKRLRAEGRALTRTVTARSVPAGHDVRIQGPDPVRVLLVGGGYAVGYGTRTRTEALDGALARVLHTRTGRGVVVENRSQEGLRLEQLAASLGPAGAHTFDLVVWTPTFEEGSRALLRSRWIAGVGLMLRKIELTSDAAVVLVGFPGLVGNQPIAVLGRARSAQINRLLALIAKPVRSCVVVEPPDVVLRDLDALDGRGAYQAVAVRLLPAVARLLPAAPVALADRRAEPPAGPPPAAPVRVPTPGAEPAPARGPLEQAVLTA